MQPFPRNNRCRLTRQEKIFNWRLSRARRVVENAFGIMSSRFRIFYRCIILDPEIVDSVVTAATVLHNFLLVPGDQIADEAAQGVIGGIAPGIQPLRNQRANHAPGEGILTRNQFCDYFNSPHGSIPEQEGAI